MLFGSSSNVNKIPGRAFEQNIACLFRDFGLCATHHARHRERTFFIANENIHRSKRSFSVIKRNKLFTVFRRTRDDLDILSSRAFFQYIIIKCMKRLAEFEHGIIRRIHDVIDRTHARQFELALDLIRTGFDFYIANQSKHKARIEFGIGNLNRNQFFD